MGLGSYRINLGKDTWHPLHRRLGGPQGQSVRVREISPPPGFDPGTAQPIASRYISVVSSLYHLRRWNRQSVPKSWRIKFRSWRFSQKKEYHIQNRAKVSNQESLLLVEVIEYGH
jgi:hypothetical protein